MSSPTTTPTRTHTLSGNDRPCRGAGLDRASVKTLPLERMHQYLLGEIFQAPAQE